MAPNRNMDRVKELAGGQAPFAAFLSCADSRVPVEMLFDQGFGDVFVCRVAGNIVNTETIGSLEFGCAVLGAKVLYVLGHSSCGAVNATIAGAPVPGVISSLYYGIKPGCDAGHGDLDKSIAENVKFQVDQLAYSPVLKELVEAGKLKIIGGVYDLASGKVNRVC
jgi:carbonic anhydrase